MNTNNTMRFFTSFIFLFTLGFASYAQTGDRYAGVPEQGEVKAVQIFPNPAVDFVHVKVNGFSSSAFTLSLHNIIGNEIPVETEIVDEDEVRIWVKDLAAGYYLVAIKDEGDKFRGTYKFLKR